MENTLEQDIRNALAILEAGGTILYPTDTVWGIGCDATNEEAVKSIFKIKNRAEAKSFVLLLPSSESIVQFVSKPIPNLTKLLASFNRPTTVIYSNAKNIAKNAIHSDGTVAIRVTSDPFCKQLLEQLKRPLVSTSANSSGQPSPKSFSEIEEIILNNVDYVVAHRQNEENTLQNPSRIIKIEKNGAIIVLRD